MPAKPRKSALNAESSHACATHGAHFNDAAKRVACTVPALPEPQPDTLRIFSANVQDLPHNLADKQRKQGPYPATRFDCLGYLASQFDVAMLQEDFTRRKKLRPATLPHVWNPDRGKTPLKKNSGISILSKHEITRIDMQRYNACHGGLGHAVALRVGKAFGAQMKSFDSKADCLSSKSFKIARIQGITFINSHLDAGTTAGDIAARGKQFAQLGRATPAQGPLVIALDANIYENVPQDCAMLAQFMRDHNLTLSLRDETDVILTRGVEVLDKKVIPLSNLSDHNGLAVTIRLPKPNTPSA